MQLAAAIVSYFIGRLYCFIQRQTLFQYLSRAFVRFIFYSNTFILNDIENSWLVRQGVRLGRVQVRWDLVKVVLQYIKQKASIRL